MPIDTMKLLKTNRASKIFSFFIIKAFSSVEMLDCNSRETLPLTKLSNLIHNVILLFWSSWHTRPANFFPWKARKALFLSALRRLSGFPLSGRLTLIFRGRKPERIILSALRRLSGFPLSGLGKAWKGFFFPLLGDFPAFHCPNSERPGKDFSFRS